MKVKKYQGLKNMKKICVALLLFVFLNQMVCPLYSMAEPVSDSYQVTVYDTGDEGLALKEYPDFDSTRFFMIQDGTVLLIDQITEDGWGHTSYHGRSGWVFLQYTRVFGEYHTQFPSYGFIPPEYYMVLGTGGEGLEFRVRPAAESSTFGPLCDESVLYVQAVQGEWAFAYCNGQFGWANMMFLSEMPYGGHGDPVECPSYGFIEPTYYAINNAEDGLELRYKPIIESNILESIPNGSNVLVLAIQEGWAFVFYKWYYGWCNIAYMEEANDQNYLALENDEITDKYDLNLLTEQIREVLFRYNYMDSHNGCTTLSFEKVSPNIVKNLEFPIGDLINENSPVYKYLDCHTIEEVLAQRREYFSDEILWADEEFSKYLTEYNGDVYFTQFVSDSNFFRMDDLYIIYIDDSNIIATCTRGIGGSLFRFRLTFTYYNYHLKLVSMEGIF